MDQAANDLQTLLYTIPNVPYDSVPEGVGADDNVCLLYTSFEEGEEGLHHIIHPFRLNKSIERMSRTVSVPQGESTVICPAPLTA